MSTSEEEFPRKGLMQYADVIADVCATNQVDPELLLKLVELEPLHRNLHAYGARPKLRREIETLIEPYLPVP
jgi:hypothetical protein